VCDVGVCTCAISCITATVCMCVLCRGVYLCCILYHRDRVLVTYDEYPPIVEVDENFPSNLGLAVELHWLMKVALKWCDIKALRQDVDKSVSSGAMHFRSKVLQAILLQQVPAVIRFLFMLRLINLALLCCLFETEPRLLFCLKEG
jgi:hypothetical protein